MRGRVVPELNVEPSEWVVIIHRRVYVVIRRVTIGVEEYWRVVTGDEERASRKLVGYWGSLDEASHNALAYVEQQLPSAWMATGTSTFHAPPSFFSHASVASGVQCEMAMKRMPVCRFARDRM